MLDFGLLLILAFITNDVFTDQKENIKSHFENIKIFINKKSDHITLMNIFGNYIQNKNINDDSEIKKYCLLYKLEEKIFKE